MKIKKMTATFGGLDQAVLTPSDGLTIISAPNEGGKSTWAGFLKAMLYGIDTHKRDKNGFLAEKNRYQPWSGAPMWGELQLEWEGRDITIRRTTNKSGPMQAFEAVYTATGDPVPGLTGASVGQNVVGAGREVFVRTALVGQNGTVVTNNDELESRVAALATSGQEDVSYSATERTLKDWRNRRKSNRSNGLIPELEGELAQVEETLDELKLARDRRAQAERQLKVLEEERRALDSDLEIYRRLAQRDLNRRYGQALEALAQAEAKLDELPSPDQTFAGLTAQQAREQARVRMEEACARREKEESHRAALTKRLKREKFSAVFWSVLWAMIGLVALTLGIVLSVDSARNCGIGILVCAVGLALLIGRKAKNTAAELAALPEVGQPDHTELARAETYANWLGKKELLEQELRHCRQRAEDLKAQGAQEFDTLEMLHTPARSAAETAARITAVEREMARWQSQLDQAIGALQSDPLMLEARRDELLAEIGERTRQFDALDIALKELEKANSILRERFSPALNQEAARIFAKLTGGKYSRLSLSRDFSALAATQASPEAHSGAYLSAGTVDQLYLAVRLAMCRLTLPDVPILLDDALAAFDDGRARLALECLKELAQERQILLFTCHSREVRWANENNIPVIAM